MSQFYMPVKIVSGRGCVLAQSTLFSGFGKKAMIVSGRNSAKRNGSEADVLEALKKEKIEALVYDRIESNPTIESCYEAAEYAKAQKVDFLVAIGGGSPMDAAKAIALLARQDIPKDRLFSGNYEKKRLPMVFIPTTAGTGSEVTQYSILTNHEAKTKSGLATEVIFPDLAFLDGRYTESLSLVTTIHTAVDALSHSAEGMISTRANCLSDLFAKDSIERITRCIPALLQAKDGGEGIDEQVREELLLASMMAGVVIAQTGTTVVHGMGYSLTYFKEIDHGRANGLLLGHYLELIEERKPELSQKVVAAMGLKEASEVTEILQRLLGEGDCLSKEEVLQYAKVAFLSKNMNNCQVKPTEEEIVGLYEKGLQCREGLVI